MDSKKLDTCSRDAISWLPEEILGKILSSLPTKQAVSTSVLSKKWRDVFRLVHNLDFNDSLSGEDKLDRDVLPESVRNFLEIIDFSSPLHAEEECEQARYVFPESFKNFVDRTLALQCDYPIKKFSLKCHIVGGDNGCRKICVDRWISNVVERGVLELDLRIRDRGIHVMPPQLFASKTLVKLTLGRKLYLGKLPSDVSLPSLKTLFIDTVDFFRSDDLCCVLLAGCPVLEELSVHHIDFEGTPHTISSPTVKRLSIYYNCEDRKYFSLNLPNLVYLEYSDFALSRYPQVNLESLVEAKLDLCPVGYELRPLVTELLLGIRNLLLGLINVEILHLSPVSVDAISKTVKRYGLVLPVFNNLVNLYFGRIKNKRGWKLLAYLLKQSPNLETLIIQDLNGYTCNDVSLPLNKVKMLHILGYRETVESLKQLKSFVGEFKCLEMVQVNVVEEDDVLQTKRDLKMLLGVSLPSKCHFKVA